MAKDANYWNNKWKKAPIIYSGRALRTKKDSISVDVKSFIKKNDAILEEIIKKNRLKKGNHDKTAHAIQKFVVKNLTYKYDKDSVKVPEFWQFPFETIQGKVGDCEDGAILIAALCINAGVPSHRIKVAAGYVKSSPTAPQGGHGYAIYLANDDYWRILDWCIADNRHTLIQTPNGGKRISKLKKDDWIIGYDEEKNEPALTQIKKLGNRKADNIYKVEFENSDSIYSTGEHPYYVDGKWVRTDELEEGMEPYWVQPRNLFHQFHNHKKDPWRKEAAKKIAEINRKNGVYSKLAERQKNNNVFTWPSVRKKLSKNNCMKRPEILEKAFKTRTNGKMSGPELRFVEYCKQHNLPTKFVGDGNFWIRTKEGSKNPDFLIPGTKKLIEVSHKDFEYFRNWEDYKKERTNLFNEKGFEVEYILFDHKGICEPTNIDKIHSFILNGNKITKITKIKREKTVWNLHCEPHNNYFVNGNLVHNCYYEDSKLSIAKKPFARNGGYKGCYKDVWFTFNDEYSWNQKQLTINGRISENQKAKKDDHINSSKDKLKLIAEGFKK